MKNSDGNIRFPNGRWKTAAGPHAVYIYGLKNKNGLYDKGGKDGCSRFSGLVVAAPYIDNNTAFMYRRQRPADKQLNN